MTFATGTLYYLFLKMCWKHILPHTHALPLLCVGDSYHWWQTYCFFLTTCMRSYLPRTHLSLTPGTSRNLPGLTKTMLCSCRLWPCPGTYATISLPVVSRTNTHLRLAELGFLGFLISVFRTTPLAKGLLTKGFLFLRIFWIGPVRCICCSDAVRAPDVVSFLTWGENMSGLDTAEDVTQLLDIVVEAAMLDEMLQVVVVLANGREDI